MLGRPGLGNATGGIAPRVTRLRALRAIGALRFRRKSEVRPLTEKKKEIPSSPADLISASRAHKGRPEELEYLRLAVEALAGKKFCECPPVGRKAVEAISETLKVAFAGKSVAELEAENGLDRARAWYAARAESGRTQFFPRSQDEIGKQWDRQAAELRGVPTYERGGRTWLRRPFNVTSPLSPTSPPRYCAYGDDDDGDPA